MATKALRLNDPRVEHKYDSIGHYTYYYMLAKPSGKPAATVLLCHGWPDLSMAWRYQIPYLLSMNLQVIAPDMLGYGKTSAPDSPAEYTMKKMSDDMAKLISKHITPGEQIILGGHDWGAGFAWMFARYYPQLIRALFSICVPYAAPSPVKTPLEEIAKKIPQFGYQLQFASGDLEKTFGTDRQRLRKFIDVIYGGRGPSGEATYGAKNGIRLDLIDKAGPTKLMSPEMADYYAQEYSRHGLRGPCNWYRTRTLNHEGDVELAKEVNFKFRIPTLLIMATKDVALPPRMANGQHRHFDEGKLRVEVVDGSHWAMWDHSDDVNRYIGEHIKSVLGADAVKSSL